MMPVALEDQTPVAPPSYHRAQARLGPALHINSLPGFMLCSVPLLLFLGIPKSRRTVLACHQLGPEKNSASAAASSASLDAFFSFSISSAHLCVAGPRLLHRSP